MRLACLIARSADRAGAACQYIDTLRAKLLPQSFREQTVVGFGCSVIGDEWGALRTAQRGHQYDPTMLLLEHALTEQVGQRERGAAIDRDFVQVIFKGNLKIGADHGERRIVDKQADLNIASSLFNHVADICTAQ